MEGDIGLTNGLAVAAATLLSSMIAEPAGSINLRGTVLDQELSQAASMAGGDVFQEAPGLRQEAKELVVALGTTLATKAIGHLCAKRNRLQASEADGSS